MRDRHTRVRITLPRLAAQLWHQLATQLEDWEKAKGAAADSEAKPSEDLVDGDRQWLGNDPWRPRGAEQECCVSFE